MITEPRIPIPHERIAAFCERWQVREFALFGSILRDDFGPESDVDVLVTLSDDAALSLWDWTEMIDELRELFGRDVDLVERSGLRNPFRRREILRTMEVVHAT